jgi:hypothetical protein
MEETNMPILPLPQHISFDPEQIETITSAYEKAFHQLRLTDDDPRAQVLAKNIIALAQDGQQDPDRLCELALQGSPRPR